MEIETSSTEAAIAADAKRTEASAEQVETQESVDSNESETSEDSETSDNAESSEEQEAEDSSEDDGQEEENEEKESEKKSDLPKGLKKRLGRLTRQRQEAKQEAEYWKREALKRQEQSAPKEEDLAPQAVEGGDAEPQEEDFDSHKDYVRAFVKWELRQEKLKEEQKSKEAQAKSAFEKQKQAHIERVQKFKEQTPDFDDVVAEFIEEHGTDGDFRFTSVFEQAIIDSEVGPALLYELTKNPEELKRINSLGFVSAARELGKLEAKLSSNSSKIAKQTTTKAPAPPTPLGGKSEKAVKKSIYDKDLSFEEYERLRLEQLKQKGS